MAKLSSEFSQVMQTSRDGPSQSGGSSSNGRASSGQVERCPQCGLRFSSVTDLVDHVEKDHERGGTRTSVMKVTVDVCPKCSRGFRDPVALVQHVERDHGGAS